MDALDTTTLEAAASGPVLGPDGDGFADEVACFNLRIAHTPQVVVGAESAEDVAAAVRFARENGLKALAHATGHTEAAAPDGVLISTRRLDKVEVDPGTKIASVGGGARWAAVLDAASPHGLTAVPGSSGNVGVAGYLVGGGIGPLARSHGFSSDYLESAEVVTGAGEIVTASATENADLLWALRGGKGGLGVITEAELRLPELPELYGGTLRFDTGDIEAAFRAWVAWTADADPRVTTSAAIVNFPPFEFLPEPLRGKRLLGIRFAFPGPASEGERLAEPLRAAAPVYMDEIKELTPAEMPAIHADPTDPAPAWVAGTSLQGLDDDFASAHLELAGEGADNPWTAFEVRHYGSDATRTDIEGGSAVGGRGSDYTLAMIMGGDPAEIGKAGPPSRDRVLDALAPWLSTEGTPNFATNPRTQEAFDSAWSADNRKRLEQIRKQYDPDSVFPFAFSA